MTSIGLALSGGGVRATVFHLGVLARLAEDGLLEKTKFLSSVSGGSIAVALVYATNDKKWPTSEVFLSKGVPEIRKKLTTSNLGQSILISTLVKPWRLLSGRAFVAAKCMEKKWSITGKVNELSEDPRWIINATTYETGKNWRIMPRRMGDYLIGYVESPEFNISEAVAASAAFPGIIGPLVLNSSKFKWFKFEGFGKSAKKVEVQCSSARLHLWDGGLYDNLGVEALFKVGEGLREGFDFLIVSDASKPLEQEQRGGVFSRANRLISVATEQARGLMSRNIVKYFNDNPGTGAYLRIGNSSEYIVQQSKATCDAELLKGCLTANEVESAEKYPTSLRKLTEPEFDRLFKHGWEVTNCTLGGWCAEQFSISKVPDFQRYFGD